MAARKNKERQVTALQRSFCRHYVANGGNGTKAVQADRPQYGDDAAAVRSSQLLSRPEVRAEIARLEGLREKESLMTADEVERYLDTLIRANLKDYYDENGILKTINKLTAEQAYALKSITSFTREGEGGTAGILGQTCERYDPLHAIKLKMQRLGMLKTRVELEGKSFEAIMREIHGIATPGEDKG